MVALPAPVGREQRGAGSSSSQCGERGAWLLQWVAPSAGLARYGWLLPAVSPADLLPIIPSLGRRALHLKSFHGTESKKKKKRCSRGYKRQVESVASACLRGLPPARWLFQWSRRLPCRSLSLRASRCWPT